MRETEQSNRHEIMIYARYAGNLAYKGTTSTAADAEKRNSVRDVCADERIKSIRNARGPG